MQRAREPVTLQVFLANSLMVPRGSANLFESNFEVSVDNGRYTIDVQGLPNGSAFDDLVTLCDDLSTRHLQPLDQAPFERLVARSVPQGTSAVLPSQLHSIYRAMKAAKDAGRDSIWKFILQHSYKPVFLMGRFDVVVGNPPWLTYADVGSAEYQDSLRLLADGYGVTSINRANMPHLEIAAIFLAHAVNYFTTPAGSVAFVLPRSFMSADQHHNTRAGMIEGLRVTELWDLSGVQPLFRVPSCVLFAMREERPARRSTAEAGLRGSTVEGRLPRPHLRLSEAHAHLSATSIQWQYSTLQPSRAAARIRSAFTIEKVTAGPGANAYFERVKQGATIVPRNFYMVEIDQDLPEGASLTDRTLTVRTSDESDAEAKGKWKGQILSGRVEGSVLFRTALSRNIVPFALVDPVLLALPVVQHQVVARRAFLVKTADELLASGLRRASAWFHEAERRFENSKSEAYKRQRMTLQRRLDYQRGISSQSPDAE